MPSIGNLKLVYFNVRGRGEMLRLMLQASGQAYEEETLTFEEWGKVKADSPYGALPYMVLNGKTYGQSTAIASFLARELGFYGSSSLDALRVDEVMGFFEDMLMALIKFRFAPNPEEKAKFEKKVKEEDVPRYFGYFEKFLKENGGTGYFVGNKLSLADFYVYDMTQNILILNGKDALKDYPLLQKLRQRVEEHPKVKAYLDNRKPTIYNF